MRYLIDTCVLLWGSLSPDKLPLSIRSLLESGGNELLVSVVTAWEIGIKQKSGRLELGVDTMRFIEATIELQRLTVLPVNLPHALAAGRLPFHHRDPFDRMLIAQAIVERVPILSPDHAFSAYPVEVIW